MTTKKKEFKSEVSQLMNILAHSLYKDREIFLRELVSNSIDALNKVRIRELSDEPFKDRDGELKIEIEADEKSRVLIVRDTGIGMNEEELVENIGTIAHSGSKAFLEKLGDSNDAKELIGQFGVGFYSVFMVAEHVTVLSRSTRQEDRAAMWMSDGRDSFETEEIAEDRPRGTEVKLRMREDAAEFLKPERLKAVIGRYSSFSSFSISVNGEKVEQEKPLWQVQPSQVKDDQYKSFYSYLSHGESEPLTWLHLHSDAPVDLKAMLYVPSYSMMKLGFEDEGGVRLYCRKVLIEDKSEDLLPGWLRFLRGVVDSEDVELNVARETIQNNPVIRKIRKTLVSRVVKHFAKVLKKDRETFEKIFDEFGVYLKEGIVREDPEKERLAGLMLFNVDAEEKRMTFDEYMEKTPEKGKIYYLTGGERKLLEKSPHLELFRKKGIPVLLLPAPVDEFVVTHLHKYKDAELTLITREDAVVNSKEEQKDKKEDDAFLVKMKQLLEDRVSDVRYSDRLVDSAYCVVSPKDGLSSSMEQMMRAMNQEFQSGKRILELNPAHQLVKAVRDVVVSGEKAELSELMANQLLDNALLLDNQAPDVNEMVNRINQLLQSMATGNHD
ncbi:MAG: molecular chaperone HtpG [Acidobacteria bacterium]|nr:molecular chaperone HtpG [Acidobacteriota bacterium]